LNITNSNQFQVRAQVDKAKSNVIQSAMDGIAELYDLHHFETDAEHWKFIDFFWSHNKYLFTEAWREEGGICGPNTTQKESNAANKCLAST